MMDNINNNNSNINDNDYVEDDCCLKMVMLQGKSGASGLSSSLRLIFNQPIYHFHHLCGLILFSLKPTPYTHLQCK